MSIKDKLMDLWQRESSAVVHGWLPGGQTYGPDDEGTRYLEISCVDLSIKYDRERLGTRRPVLQSLVTWPNRSDRITVSRTLGPSNFTALHDGDFAHLLQSGVALTGDLPMNAGSVDVVIGLLAAPGESLLDKATDFLSDLAELTQVPQLTAAAPIASKITGGVDKLLGNEETIGLLALQTSIQADALRDGYLVVTDWPAETGDLGRLRVQDGQGLEQLGDDQQWRPARGFNYVVLRVVTRPSKPDRWEELMAVSTLVQDALDELAEARTDEDVTAAGSAILVAMSKVTLEENLTREDREVGGDRIQAAWERAVAKRAKVLERTAAETNEEPDRADLIESVTSLQDIAADVNTNLKRLRARALG